MMRTFISAALLITATVVVGVSSPDTAGALDDTPWTLPETPPKCTTAQTDSGNVAGCLVAPYNKPMDVGWGVPPAPGVGAGWVWKGYTYNDSPALAPWEATHIVANTAPVAGKAPGYLETHVGARALFEGFLNEITAKGYTVHHASGYSFRCTSGSGGWSCPSGDPAGLSRHAWGLAIDMNSGTNPIRSYSGIDGKTACLTPMQTDMPRWMIQTAEKWGLYWGGYGWSSGCQSTATQRSVVTRDPPHFEFRGTPEQAAAIAAYNLRNDPAARCFDVVDTDGSTVEKCALDGVPKSTWRLPVRVDAPDEAVAAIINLTGTRASTVGSFTVEDCEARSGTRPTTSLLFAPGSAIATMAVAPLDADDTFCVWRSADAHSIVDVIAYLTDSGERLWIDPVDPTRIVDSRIEATCTPDDRCLPGPVEHEGLRRLPTTDASPRLANITTTRSQGWGWLQAGRCDDVGPGRMFSNVNYVEIGARANLTLLEGGPSGTCTYVFTGTDVIVDELARLDSEEGFGWHVFEARRVYDSEVALRGGTVTEVDLGTVSPAAAVAITVTDTERRGYATVAPCSEFADVVSDGAEPETSSVNHVAGQSATNLAFTATDDGVVCVYTYGDARITLDIQAELVASRQLGVRPVTPVRAHDSRE